MKINKQEILALSWQFITINGFNKSEALSCAWLNYKVHVLMSYKVVKFYYRKTNGDIREAYGTLRSEMTPEVKKRIVKNKTVQVYYDTERQDWRSFKKANLLTLTNNY